MLQRCPHCRAEFSLQNPRPGHRIRCPQCQRPIAVESAGPPEEVVEVRPATRTQLTTNPGRVPPRRAPASDEPARERRPAPAGRSSMLPWVLVGVLVLVLVGGVLIAAVGGALF